MKTGLLVLIIIFSFSSICMASPIATIYVQNKSDIGNKSLEDSKLVEELIKESLKGKVVFAPPATTITALSKGGIIDIEVAERNDLIQALKNDNNRYFILASLVETPTSGGGTLSFLQVEIHCRVIDAANNKYLLNIKERNTDTTYSFQKAIRRAMAPIQTELSKTTYAE